jgi:DNA-binding NarL/FixJ family response regulator
MTKKFLSSDPLRYLSDLSRYFHAVVSELNTAFEQNGERKVRSMEECRFVVVVGRNALLNQLIGFAVQQELGQGFAVETRGELPSLDERGEVPCVLLVDSADAEARDMLLQALGDSGEGKRGVVAALFNVDPAKRDVRDAIRSGVRGIFYSTVQIADMMKGLMTLLNGEICIPTQILVDIVMKQHQGENVRADARDLTQREMEILSHLSTGASNDEIASELFISPHTVKTHMYNIFRKIGVSNRLRATIWASRNLGERVSEKAFARTA